MKIAAFHAPDVYLFRHATFEFLSFFRWPALSNVLFAGNAYFEEGNLAIGTFTMHARA